MSDALPYFRYYQNPLQEGIIVASATQCYCCQQRRGYVYTGSFYTAQDVPDDLLCPWCIADGSAAEKYQGTFNNASNTLIDNQSAAADICVVVEQRTPGFVSWQESEWLFHCDDAMQFIGDLQFHQLTDYPDVEACLRQQCQSWGWDNEHIDDALTNIGPESDISAYHFRCLHCDTHLAYMDFS